MKITHNLSDELLLDYSTGALSEAWSIAVAAHLSMCSRSWAAYLKLVEVGGALLTSAKPEVLSESIFENVLDRLDDDYELPNSEVGNESEWSSKFGIPTVVSDYLPANTDKLPWKSLGLGVNQIVLETKDKSATARLLKIPAGKKVPHHSHHGRELTVVFSGGFTDTEELMEAFHRAYEQRYSHRDRGSGEVVAFRVTGFGSVDRPPLPSVLGGNDLAGSVRDKRQVIFNGVSKETIVYWREDLPLNTIFEGPAIIEELGSTTVVPPNFNVSKDSTGSLILDRKTTK